MKNITIKGTVKSRSYAFCITDPCYVTSVWKNFRKKVASVLDEGDMQLTNARGVDLSMTFAWVGKQKGVVTTEDTAGGMNKKAEIRFRPGTKDDVWVEVGSCGVDSGQIVFGDPFDPEFPDSGVLIDNFGGDGMYTVSLQVNEKSNVIKAAKIDFYYWQMFEPDNGLVRAVEKLPENEV